MTRLSEPELQAALNEMDGWTSSDDAIRKPFRFRGFRDAMAFVNRVAERAETAGHHPDLEIHYNRVIVSLSTHDEGGVTDKDVALAAEIDAVVDTDGG